MTEKRRFFLDTDIGPDCDDAAALALAVLYARQCGGKLIGVTHCTSSPWGVGAIRAVLYWYGEKDIPVGTLMDEGFLCEPDMEKYNCALAMTVSAEEREAEDAQKVLRDVLSEQPDHSVEMISIGPLRNLGNLMSDDEACALVKRKIRCLVLMAGNFQLEAAGDGEGAEIRVSYAKNMTNKLTPEWNVEMDVLSARLLAKKWSGEMIYCGWEVGEPVVAIKEPSSLDGNNPVRSAYRLYGGGVGRNSWDLCTVQWAVQPECGFYKLSDRGVIEIDEKGVSRWRADPKGEHYYIMLNAAPEEIAAAFDKTLLDADRVKGGAEK